METYLVNRQTKHPLLANKYHSFDVKDMLVNPNYLPDLREGFTNDYKVNDIDLIVGGPPCQGFSGIGHRRSYAVDKMNLPSNHLFQDYGSIIKFFRPKIFLFENVRGLLYSKWTKTGEMGEVWNDVKNTFTSIPGYIVRYALLFAKDYGVPQNRPRIILVGIREDLGIEPIMDNSLVADGFLPKPSGNYPTLEGLLGDLVDPEYTNGGYTEFYPSDPINTLQNDLRYNPSTSQVMKRGSALYEQKYSKHKPKIVDKFRYMIENNGEIPKQFQTKKFSQRLLPACWGKAGPTITATSLPDDYVHYSQPRTLTVREWARLQLFPDWYIFQGQRTTGGLNRAGNPQKDIFERDLPKYTQIGNAVPVGLAEAIGLHFIKLLGLS